MSQPAEDSQGPEVVPTNQEKDASKPNDHQIAHVLFLDVVGFTKLRSPKQRLVLSKLQDIVRATTGFSQATKAGKLIALPTGDGMALVFLTSVGGSGTAVSCAEAITHAVREHNETTTDDDATINVRMGIHSGTVVEVLDVNDRPNVAGEGINTAQRVMDCGDVGHILLSSVAYRLVPDEPDRAGQFKPLGIVKVKHDQEINLFNWAHNEIGNEETPSRITSEQELERSRFARIRAQIEQERDAQTAKVMAELKRAKSRERLWWVSAICLVMGLLTVTFLVSRELQKPPSPATLYVAPFTAKTKERYSSRSLSKGLTEDLTRGFRFLAPHRANSSPEPARSSSPGASAGTDSNQQLAFDVAKRIGARYVLIGTVESEIADGDVAKLSPADPDFGVVIDLHLYDTESSTPRKPLWSKPYASKSFNQLIKVEESVIEDVSAQIKMTPDRDAYDPQRHEAHWNYLVGRFWAFQRTHATGADKKNFAQRAIDKYKQVTSDPYYALAQAGLADIYLSTAGAGQDPRKASKDALEAALRAAEASQKPHQEVVAEPYAAIGTQKWWLERDFLTARMAFRLAINLNPNLADSHKRYSSCLAVLGKVPEAADEMRRALELEPESSIFQFANGQNYVFAGDYDAAIEQLQRLVSSNPKMYDAYRFLAIALEQKRGPADALVELEKVENLIRKEAEKTNPGSVVVLDSDFLSTKAHVLAGVGRTDDAMDIVRELIRRKKVNEETQGADYISPYNLAVIFTAFTDRKTDVLGYLNEAVRSLDPRANWMNVDPRFKNWRESPEFVVLLQEAGLAEPGKDSLTPNVARR